MSKKNVFVVIDMSAGISAREVLAGIFKFVNAGRPWALRLIQLPGESLAATVAGELEASVDGLIVTCESDERSNRMIAAATDVPTVFVDVRNDLFERRSQKATFVRNDNEEVGAAGARYLASLGDFNAFGFVPDIDGRPWSTLRERAFRRTLERRGRAVRTFDGGSKHPAEDQARMVDWLRELPKPAALMAAYDFRATQVCEACAVAGLRLPEQVALIGVDNDELLCTSVTPALSSVRPDHVHEGYLGAAELDRLFRLGRRAMRREVFCRISGIVERESTRPGPPSATLIRRALAFIDANDHANLRVTDVATDLGVSRRLLERRFREIRGESVNDCILARRLAVVRRLLKTTRRSCAKIAVECGFPSANYLSHLFTRKTGLSMRAYRARSGKNIA